MASSPPLLREPLILVNFKAYLEAIGPRAVELAKACEKVAAEFGVSVAVATQPSDIAAVSRAVRIPVFAQHIDPVKAGSFTGHIVAEAVKAAGAVGTLLNHSERRLSLGELEGCIRRAKDSGLVTVVCGDTPEACGRIAALKPDAVAIEPPELIGTGIPVSKAKPEVVTAAVRAVKEVDAHLVVLCGAGISRGEDVSAALRLGTRGVLLASGVVKAERPEAVLREMAGSLKP